MIESRWQNMKFDQIIEKLQNKNVHDSWIYYKELCKSPQSIQMSVLNSILKENSISEFGKKHNFSNIKNIHDFKNEVPLSTWADYEKASVAMQKGAENILFTGKPDCFIMTSGTSGKQKFIPETALGKKTKAITDKLRRNFTLNSHPEILKGRIFPLVNRSDLGLTENGIPFGTASGLTMKNAPESLLKTCAYPPEILNVRNDKTMDYLLMRFALNHDVRLIVGNNIARMGNLSALVEKHAEELISEINSGSLNKEIEIDSELREKLEAQLFPDPKRAAFLQKIIDSKKMFIPKNYWPALKVICCWLSGSVGSSVSNVKYLFPDDVKYLDYGYGASEGKFNIPCIPGKSYGTLAIHACFYEFIPVDCNNDSSLMVHEIEEGKLYKLLITNFAGLYRYDMKDIVRVESFTENTPNIVFVSKCGDIGNIAGEKLSGSTICNAAEKVSEETGINIKHICAITVTTPPHYIFCIELQNSNNDLKSKDEIKNLLDIELQKDIGYANRRRDNLLTEPELKIMPAGWLDSLYEEKVKTTGNSIAQIKLPIIYKEAAWQK